MTAKEKVNILMVDDQPAKLLSYEVILGELGEIGGIISQRVRRSVGLAQTVEITVDGVA